MKAYLTLLLCFVLNTASGQLVLWASKVYDYSSQRSPLEFSVNQILGKPNALPPGGESPNAWSPKRMNNHEFVLLGFDMPIAIKQIAVAESFTPGAMVAVHTVDTQDQEHLLFELDKEPSGLKGSMFNFFMPETPYKVKALRLEFDGSRVEGYFNIDAVAISNSEVPIEAQININEQLRGDLQAEPLGNHVNSSKSELRPLLSPDGSALFFSRQYHDKNSGGAKDPGDIWVSNYDNQNQTWLPAVTVGTPLNTPDEEFMTAITAYGTNMVALIGGKSNKKTSSQPQIALTDNMSGNWRKPVDLDFVHDPEIRGNVDITLARDRKVMVLSAQLDNSFGDQDLYVSFLQRNGLWSDPLNLGKIVNSAGSEGAPFLAQDDKTMYFASSGRSGYGGSDIYKTVRLDETWKNWSEPENLGPAINSSKDELYFTVPPKSGFAYFSRFVEEHNADVFKVRLPLYETVPEMITFTGTLYDQKSRLPITAVMDYGQGRKLEVNGHFQVEVEKTNHIFTVSTTGYYPKYDTIDFMVTQSDTHRKDYYLEPIDSVLAVNQIRFESNDKRLLKNSFKDLEAVVEIMKRHPAVRLEIASHTDNIGSHEANMNLSKARAEEVMDYFLSKGILRSRLELRWFGETQPLDTNDTESGRMKNRRVEFRVMRN